MCQLPGWFEGTDDGGMQRPEVSVVNTRTEVPPDTPGEAVTGIHPRHEHELARRVEPDFLTACAGRHDDAVRHQPPEVSVADTFATHAFRVGGEAAAQSGSWDDLAAVPHALVQHQPTEPCGVPPG